jgi:flavodoxin
MKTAVVYYSLDGSTRVAAQALAERLGADIYELREVKQRSSNAPKTFVSGGFAAALGLKSRLQDTFAGSMGAYERVCVGTPIWAGHPTPAANAFIKAFDPAGKQVMLFTAQADPDPQSSKKGTEKLCARIRKKGGALLPALRLHGEAPGKTATKAQIEAQLDQKLEDALKIR